MSQDDISGGARRLAESVWMVLAARLVSIVGVPMAGFLFMQIWTDVRTSTAMLQALSVRMSVSETDRQAVKDRVSALELEIREIRRYLIERRNNPMRRKARDEHHSARPNDPRPDGVGRGKV